MLRERQALQASRWIAAGNARGIGAARGDRAVDGVASGQREHGRLMLVLLHPRQNKKKQKCSFEGLIVVVWA